MAGLSDMSIDVPSVGKALLNKNPAVPRLSEFTRL